MKFKVLHEAEKRYDSSTGKLVEEKTLLWIADANTGKKIALLCTDCDQYANLLAAAPDLFKYVQERLNDFNKEVPFEKFDEGAKLLNQARGD